MDILGGHFYWTESKSQNPPAARRTQSARSAPIETQAILKASARDAGAISYTAKLRR